MGRSVASGAVYLGASQACRLLTTIIGAVVISRILSPSDYGVVAMAAPITAFILLFQDIGLNQATIQARTVTEVQSSSLFWLNMMASAATVVVLLIAAPLVAIFYHDWRPGALTAASALTVLVAGSSLQHLALLERHMQFRSLSIIDVVTAVVALAATIVGALVLKSFWALWLGGVVGVLVGTTMAWLYDPWRPQRVFDLKSIGAFMRFGSGVAGFNLLNFLTRNLDNVFVARFSGAAQLGLYDRSYKLMMLPLQNINAPLARLILPVLSRLQDEPKRYREVFLTTVGALMFVSVPAIAVSAAASDQLVLFLLGPKWAAAGPIFFWLSLVGLISPLANATGWLFLTSGRTGAMTKWGAFSAVVTIVGFIIGVRWGAEGVAASFFVTAAGRMPLLFPYCSKGTAVSTRDLYASLLAPGLNAALAYAVTRWLSGPLTGFWLLATSTFAAYASGFVIYLCIPASRQTLLRTIELTLKLLPGRFLRSSFK